MSHGEHWIVPTNYVLLASAAVLWYLSVPVLVASLVFLPLGGLLFWMASDKYGGMFVTLISTPSLFVSAKIVGTMIQQAKLEDNARLGVPEMVLWGYFYSILGALLFASPFLVGGVMVSILFWHIDRKNQRANTVIEGDKEHNGKKGQLPPR